MERLSKILAALCLIAGIMCVAFGGLFAFGVVTITFGAIVVAILGFGVFLIITGLEGLKNAKMY